MPDVAAIALLHTLVFVYWLGGDLGAFNSSQFLTRPGVSADRRMLAASIVGNVDMAPRSALILALPTGLWLASARGWIEVSPLALFALWVAGLGWLALAWRLHLTHGASGALKILDLAIRWIVLLALLAAGAAALAGVHPLPLFLALKMILLAGAILMGLLIRRVLTPLGQALMGLGGDDAAEAEVQLATTLKSARPLVVVIWIILITAAFLGLWTPTTF